MKIWLWWLWQIADEEPLHRGQIYLSRVKFIDRLHSSSEKIVVIFRGSRVDQERDRFGIWSRWTDAAEGHILCTVSKCQEEISGYIELWIRAYKWGGHNSEVFRHLSVSKHPESVALKKKSEWVCNLGLKTQNPYPRWMRKFMIS